MKKNEFGQASLGMRPIFKFLLFMKMSALFLLIPFLHVTAHAWSQEKFTFRFEQVDAAKVFTSIQKQSDYRFFYLSSDIRKLGKIDLNVADAALPEIMAKVLGNMLTYKIVNGNLVVISPEDKISAQHEIKGKVQDESGNPLAGVTIKIKGQPNGTITDPKGEFTIVAPDDAVLEVSYIGFETQEIPVNKVGFNFNFNFTITLKASSSGLNEVVVVGYGTQKKVDLTGAVATVGSEKLESRPLVNLADGLNGLIPNLNVNIQNGQPGTAASYNIRGVTSISTSASGNVPLILVDGVARDPNLIDPNDVASVTVLKDAASAAIYGGRAAYGVILITTKTGKKGTPQLSYSGSYTTSRPTNLPKYVNSDVYIKLFNSAQRTGGATGGYTSNDPYTELDSTLAAAYRNDPAHNPDAYPDPGNPLRYRYVGNTDWIKVVYPGWAPMQQHNLSLSGGEGKTTYVASMGYFRQEGLEKIADQVYNRYTPSLKINSDVTKWITLNLDMSLTHTDNTRRGAVTNAGIGHGGDWIPGDLRPLMPVYNPDGHFSGQGNFTNPVAVMTNSGKIISHANDFWTTGRIILTPVNHLTITSDYTWNSYTLYDKENAIPFNEYGVDGAFLDVYPWTKPSQLTEKGQNNTYKAFNAYATYENTFNQKHYFKAMVGYNQEYQHYMTDSSVARNLIDPTLPAIGTNNDPKPFVSGIETEYALVGTFFRLNYIYDHRYLLEINGRYDGTSRFKPDDRYAFSPSVSAGWNIAEESFMQNLKSTISELKIRASYGQLPNQLAPNGVILSRAQYPYIATLPKSTVAYLMNDQPAVTVTTPQLISATFTWEKVQTRNIGIDYSLLKDRLSGSFDYYITDTKDMLVPSQQLPAVLGTNAPPTNAANMRTKGWELSIDWKDYLLDNQLFYDLSLGLSDYVNKITKYGGNPTYSLNDYYPGEKLNNIWGFTTEGFYKTDEEAAAVDNSALAGYTWLAGDIKYADINHDGKIDRGNSTLLNPGDQKIIGNSTPRYQFGFNLNLAYKGFDFTAFIQGVLKRDFSPSGNVFYAFPNDEWGIPYGYAANYWTPENPNAYYARPRFAGSGNEQAQTKYLQNAAYARIKQLTLGYNLPKQLINKIKLQKIRIYVTGENLFTITSLFKGYDPELLNYQIYPINRSVSAGLQVTL